MLVNEVCLERGVELVEGPKADVAGFDLDVPLLFGRFAHRRLQNESKASSASTGPFATSSTSPSVAPHICMLFRTAGRAAPAYARAEVCRTLGDATVIQLATSGMDLAKGLSA